MPPDVESPEKPRRKSRARKPFPATTFEDALAFVSRIIGLGVDDKIRRLTLLQRLEMSPTSSTTRRLITHSARYGLTKGGYTAESIGVLPEARKAVNDGAKETHFALAITAIDPFNRFFLAYKDKRVPDAAVCADALQGFGVASDDSEMAFTTLMANLNFVGAITQVAGKDHIVMPSFEPEQIPQSDSRNSRSEDYSGIAREGQQPPARLDQKGATLPAANASLHIDVQVHIDSSASADQIDQIFKSMATHLYGNGHE